MDDIPLIAMRASLFLCDINQDEYYRSVCVTASLSFQGNQWLAVRVKACLEDGDWFLNNIPLGYWDGLAEIHEEAIRRSLKEHGDEYTLAAGVCTVKQAARDAVLDGVVVLEGGEVVSVDS